MSSEIDRKSYTAWFGRRGRGAPGRSLLVVVAAVHLLSKKVSQKVSFVSVVGSN